MHSPVEQHYTKENIYKTILSVLQKQGIPTASIKRKDTAALDEFHIRGQEITRALANEAGLTPGMRLLDVGCGIGGPCRFFADEYECIATGIDITADYIATAKKLSQLTGLQQGTHFVHGSATALPFGNKSFDLVWTQHAQMNIADKKRMYEEIARVLIPGGKFVYYDIFGTGDGSLHFPVPWANDASISYLISPGELNVLLNDVGLEQVKTTDQTAASISFLSKLEFGKHILMGENAIEKQQNLVRNLTEKKIVVESGIAIKTL